MKKSTIVVSFATVAFFIIPLLVAAQQSGFVPLAPIPGLTKGVTADQAELANFFNNLYKYLIGVAAALAVIMITWGGLEIAVNKDNVSKITDSKGKILNAIFGLVLVLSPVLIFSIINPSILNLSLNLPQLDTVSGPPAQTTNSTPRTTCRAGTLSNANCTTNTVSVGLYSSAQSGGWCYQIANCTTSSCTSECGASGCNYSCGNQTQCEADFGQDQAAVGSCRLIP